MSDDRRLAEIVGEALQPKPMNAAARTAFRREVQARIEADAERRMPWRAALVLATSAAVGAALWFSLPSSPTPAQVVREAAPAPGREERATESAEERNDTPVLAAFADPDEMLDEADVSEDYLPDDYFVLASLVDELDG